MTDRELLPLPKEECLCGQDNVFGYTADQMLAYAAACVAAERDRWIGGVRVKVPTETMEQEFTAQRRMGINQERGRIRAALMAMHEQTAGSHNYFRFAVRELFGD